MFNRATASYLWSAQRAWSIRVFKGESFSIVSPTGTGKTLFGIIMSIYLTGRPGKHAYIILPTTPLVLQVYDRTDEIIRRLGLKRDVIYYYAGMPRREKMEFINRLKDGDYDILITTSTFLSRKFDILRNEVIDFIFVDDVDAVLKSSRNIDRLLILMGFDENTIATTLELIRLKRLISRLKEDKEKIEVLKQMRRLQEVVSKRKREIRSVLIVSSATGRPRGTRVRLFKELLGFEVGTRTDFIRNIIDAYLHSDGRLEDTVLRIINELGQGGLIFIPVDKGIEYAEYLNKYLRSKGVRSDILVSGRSSSLQNFIDGNIDVLIGMAVYYGVMVRGLDLPEHIRYAVFAGVPRFKFTAKFEDPTPSMILRALTLLYSVEMDSSKRRVIERYLSRMRRLVLESPYVTLARIREKILKGEPPSNYKDELVYNALDFVRSELAKSDVISALKEHPDIKVYDENGEIYLMIPDVMSYIQASGRTSRMYVGGLTRGLSIVIADDNKLMEGLKKRSRWIIEDIEWRDYDELDIDDIRREIDKDRERVRLLRTGRIAAEFKDPIKTILLVVESPNKAKTIASFFGRPSIRRYGKNVVYEVSTGDRLLIITASGGHVYDIITDYKGEDRENLYGVIRYDESFIPVYTSIKRCRRSGYQFTSDSREDMKRYCPDGDIMDKIDVVRFLQELALEVDKVLIGTDPDSEGEKIGWDLAVLLRPYTNEIERIEFHEVTKRAILRALASPRDFDMRLVEAQLVRRIADRWIGFALSEWLTHEVDSSRILSAGRVQTPVLGWVIDRWLEWSKPENKKRIFTLILENGLRLEYLEEELPSKYSTSTKLKGLGLRVSRRKIGVEVLNPPPPYMTATMIEEATRSLNIGADTVMRLAQDLFEMGLITYHRTDSTRVSSKGRSIAREYIEHKWPDEAKHLFIGRSWGEGGAHECIRPTRAADANAVWNMVMEGSLTTIRPFTMMHRRLYGLIFKRFVASQMSPAEVRSQYITFDLDGSMRDVKYHIEVLKEGFLKVSPDWIKTYEPIEGHVAVIKEVYEYVRTIKPLYKQGDLIRLMRERRIGRPSTYSKIIEVLLKRGYVIETKKNRYLYPTRGGIAVYNYLKQYFGEMVSEETTRRLEEVMDAIELGNIDYQSVLEELYGEITRINI
jgi:reverse gyrase